MSLRRAELRGIWNVEQFPDLRLVREEIYYTVIDEANNGIIPNFCMGCVI
jgi:hypothetical protein